MGNQYALGLTGGTGGVDDIGAGLVRVAAAAVDAQFQRGCGQQLVEGQHAQGRAFRQFLGIADHQAQAAVTDDVLDAFARVLRVDRDIGTAGLEDAEQADNQVGAARQVHAHPQAILDAFVTQTCCQLRRQRVELGIAQCPSGVGHRRSLGKFTGPGTEYLMQEGTGRERGWRGVNRFASVLDRHD